MKRFFFILVYLASLFFSIQCTNLFPTTTTKPCIILGLHNIFFYPCHNEALNCIKNKLSWWEKARCLSLLFTKDEGYKEELTEKMFALLEEQSPHTYSSKKEAQPYLDDRIASQFLTQHFLSQTSEESLALLKTAQEEINQNNNLLAYEKIILHHTLPTIFDKNVTCAVLKKNKLMHDFIKNLHLEGYTLGLWANIPRHAFNTLKKKYPSSFQVFGNHIYLSSEIGLKPRESSLKIIKEKMNINPNQQYFIIDAETKHLEALSEQCQSPTLFHYDREKHNESLAKIKQHLELEEQK